MDTLHLFKSNLPSSKYVFRSGRVAEFVGGNYLTKNQEEINELTKEISYGHPHIFVEAGRETVAADELDPMSVLRKKIRNELLAEMQEASGNPHRDMGNTTQHSGAGQLNTAGLVAAASSIKVPGKK